MGGGCGTPPPTPTPSGAELLKGALGQSVMLVEGVTYIVIVQAPDVAHPQCTHRAHTVCTLCARCVHTTAETPSLGQFGTPTLHWCVCVCVRP